MRRGVGDGGNCQILKDLGSDELNFSLTTWGGGATTEVEQRCVTRSRLLLQRPSWQ